MRGGEMGDDCREGSCLILSIFDQSRWQSPLWSWKKEQEV